LSKSCANSIDAGWARKAATRDSSPARVQVIGVYSGLQRWHVRKNNTIASNPGRSRMGKLSLAAATLIIDAALAEARKRSLRPMTVVVLDAGGYEIALKREDAASPLRPKIAKSKAAGAIGMGRGGREIRRTAISNPIFFSMLTEITEGNISPVLGGVLIRDEGEIVGAVGITGDTAENDESCAIIGIVAAGLQADPGPD
jgi:uncharacterized protein GlcG (DUF336 family)